MDCEIVEELASANLSFILERHVMSYKRGEFEVQKVGFIYDQMGYVLIEAPIPYTRYTVAEQDDNVLQVSSAEDGKAYPYNIIMNLETVLKIMFAADDMVGRAEAAEALA